MIIKATRLCIFLVAAGCTPLGSPLAPLGPMSDPSMGYSAEEFAQYTGIPVEAMHDESQCQRSNAIMGNPMSSANERYGALTAGRANGCPGY